MAGSLNELAELPADDLLRPLRAGELLPRP